MNEDPLDHEALVLQLNDASLRAEYAAPYDHYRPGLLPRILGWLLVASGSLIYGRRPSYGKFKAIEIIARIPYQSWEVAAYTLLSAFYSDEKRAIELTKLGAFSRMAQDNETMHVVVIAGIARKRRCTGFFRHMLVPLLFALVYFWMIYLLALFSRRSALELNYIFENHAYHQYDEFLRHEEQHLRTEPVMSDFLTMYGRNPRNQYELFESIRNDELIHRNRSIRELNARP